MQVFNSFQEMAEGTGQTGGGQMTTFNAPYVSVGDSGVHIDFHVEDYFDGRAEFYQGERDEQSHPIDPNIVSQAEKSALQKNMVGFDPKFYGEIPSKLTDVLGSGYIVSDGMNVVKVLPDINAVKVYVVEKGDDIEKYSKLPVRWEDWAFIK